MFLGFLRSKTVGTSALTVAVAYTAPAHPPGTAYTASRLLARCLRWRERGGCQRWKFFRPSQARHHSIWVWFCGSTFLKNETTRNNLKFYLGFVHLYFLSPGSTFIWGFVFKLVPGVSHQMRGENTLKPYGPMP